MILCIAVIRSRFAPWPLALLLPVGAFAHLAADAVGSPAVDVVAFVVFGVGFIVLGVRLLKA